MRGRTGRGAAGSSGSDDEDAQGQGEDDAASAGEAGGDDSDSSADMLRMLHDSGSVVMVYLLMKPRWSRRSHSTVHEGVLSSYRQ